VYLHLPPEEYEWPYMSSADRGWKELGDDAAWEALLSAKAYSRARAELGPGEFAKSQF
jgi:hypothetical protein